MHKTFIFFGFDDGEIRPVAQADYVKLLRGESRLPEHANRVLRIAARPSSARNTAPR